MDKDQVEANTAATTTGASDATESHAPNGDAASKKRGRPKKDEGYVLLSIYLTGKN